MQKNILLFLLLQTTLFVYAQDKQPVLQLTRYEQAIKTGLGLNEKQTTDFFNLQRQYQQQMDSLSTIQNTKEAATKGDTSSQERALKQLSEAYTSSIHAILTTEQVVRYRLWVEAKNSEKERYLKERSQQQKQPRTISGN
ncbi:hypothetical protein ACTJIJ_10765 [Niabella sp. 22666]|uniref:hypothetical protein n=1 Tax=Niabella sp. 22666 TaxID=3453954 RepID=UPI003F87B312